jgi:L-fuconolactonase
MRIDAHQHVWSPATASYPWLTGLEPIDREMALAEILPTMRQFGVHATVLVQAADNADDTANMLREADLHPEVVGIVAWVPLDRPDETERMLAHLREDRRVVGIRTLLHANPDPDWVLRTEVDEGLSMLESEGVTFDYVTGDPAALAHLPGISERHPELSIVIDHLGKPPVAADRSEWRALIEAAAQNPRVFAKLSGLYASSGPLDGWSLDDIRPIVDDALEVFGPDRLMVGSDWPIAVLAGGYERTMTALVELTTGPDRDALLGGTAARFYNLDPALLAAARKDTP